MIDRSMDRDKQPKVGNNIGRQHSSRLRNGPAGPDVTVFGEAMVTFAPTTEVAIEGADMFRPYTSGAEYNVAVGLARLGFSVAWISRLGTDPLASLLRHEAEGLGIDTQYVAADGLMPTGFQLKGRAGEVQVASFRTHSAATALAPNRLFSRVVARSRHLHVTGIPAALSESARALSFNLMDAAAQNDVSTTFDPNLRPSLWPSDAEMRQVVNDLAVRAEWVLPGIAEGDFLTGSSDPESIANYYLDRGCRGVVVKLGAAGSVAITSDEVVEIPGFAVEEVDSFGAGDGFAAGFISGLLDESSLGSCLLRANAIGALAVTCVGDNEGLPTRAQLSKFLDGFHRL